VGYTVLIPQDVAEEGKRYLRERGYVIRMGSGIAADTLKKEVEECDAILVRTAPLTADVLRAAKKLRVIAKHGIGVDNIDVAAATERGIYVTYAPLSNAATVAEHTLGLMIALAKNLVRCDKACRSGDFTTRHTLPGMDLEGKTLGLIGLGRIGSMVAKKAALGLDMKVIGYDPHVAPEKVAAPVERTADREQVFRIADFISLHVPATPETKKIVGKREFALMKPTAYLINASRGEVVDEAALVEALQRNEIAGAGLDVFEQEPPSADNPLFRLESVIVTPHNAALTREATTRMALHAAIGIDEVLSGKKPSWPINAPVLEPGGG
jgi:D-3-phosphoglycerate dehydrogenase